MARDSERIDRIAQALREAGMDGLVCTLPANVLLLTGYWPITGTSIAIATRDGHTVLIVPEDEKQLAESGGAAEVLTFQPASLDRITDAAEAVQPAFRGVLRKLGLGHRAVGLESGEQFEPASYASMHLYGAAATGLLNGSSVPAGDLLARLRSVKTIIELDRIRRACRIATDGFAEGSPLVEPGMKETEAAMHIRTRINVKGTGYEGVERADAYVFCMSGKNAGNAYGAYARSRAREICICDLVLTHCNSYADGYWTDISRTYCMGEPDDRQRRMYEAVFAARAAAMGAIRPGAAAAAVDKAARDVLASRGFGDRFKHPTGHGVGFTAIDHNARPRLHPKSPDRLESGTVFNVEPAIYVEEWGGMRHCDMVAVTENGAELLTPFETEIEELIR